MPECGGVLAGGAKVTDTSRTRPEKRLSPRSARVVMGGLLGRGRGSVGSLLADRAHGASRLATILVVLALTTASLSTASGSPASATDSLAGDWNASGYGAPAVVTISPVGTGGYTITAKSPVRVSGSSCD